MTSSNIVNLNDKRHLSNDGNYTRIIEEARKRHLVLKAFKGQDFDSDVWRYQGNNLIFATEQEKRSAPRIPWPEEIKLTVKAFVIANLWDTRLRAEKLSFERIQTLRMAGFLLQEVGITQVRELTNALYLTIFNRLIEKYSRPANPIQDVNAYISFLQDERVLYTLIDILSPAKHKAVQEKQGLPAVQGKMPIPELVRAIVQLKWQVEERFDGSDGAISDLLCVYTQAFQFGLGLRIGEVLRIPVDCLQKMNGELFCKVWTEKGMIPYSRYVPAVWRDVLSDVVDKIMQHTRQYREFARELENSKSLNVVKSRFDRFRSERQADAKQLVSELDEFLVEKRTQAEQTWTLKKDVTPDREYLFSEIPDILPYSSHANATADRLKAYRAWELELTAKPYDRTRFTYSVTGQAILDFVEFHLHQRANHVTEQEFLSILHGRDVFRQNSGDKSISVLSRTGVGSTAACITFDPENPTKGRAPALITRDDAAKKLTEYAHGGFDIQTQIDILTLADLFPELPIRGDPKRLKELFQVSTKQIIYVKVKTKEQYVRYGCKEGYTVAQASIMKLIRDRFVDLNFALEKELHEADLADARLDGEESREFNPTALTISSKSFSIEQKVSDHLFLRASVWGSGLDIPLVPGILGYGAVLYFFTGTDRNPGAFKRYEVDASDDAVESFQTHKGRHWRTTSLFRAGVAPAIVNRWMGRTAVQGAQYDHNTGTERAKLIGQAMMGDQNRFVGELPNTVRQWQHDEIPLEEITDYLDQTMQTIQYTPLGYCVRSLYLNPCEYNLRCLVGADGKGCKHYVFDLKDPSQRTRLLAERDKAEAELSRLLDVYDHGNGVKAVERHIKQHLIIARNAGSILEKAEELLGSSFADHRHDFLPFHKDGSYPDDCPFQCGE